MKELAEEYPQADVVMCLNDLAAMGAWLLWRNWG